MTSVKSANDVADWLAEQRADGKATIVVLHQERYKKPANPVREWSLDGVDANDIESAAVEDLVDRRLVKRQYFVVAYEPSEGGKPSFVAKVNVTYEAGTEDIITGEDAPSHAALYRAAVDGQSRAIDAVLKMMSTANAMVESLSARLVASDEAHAKVLLQLTEISELRNEREQIAVNERLSRERMAELAKTIPPVLQAVLVKWQGKAAGAEGLKSLLDSLTPEQMGTIAGSLSPEQLMVFESLVSVAHPDQKKEKANGHV
jgi:hypothetical protein